MPKRTVNHAERIGINAVATIVTSELQWIWREQREQDYGVDGHIEVVDAQQVPTGKLLGVQVKSGASYFRGEGETIFFYADEDHLSYWNQHWLPIILLLHNPDTKETIWQWVNIESAKNTGTKWRIAIPRSNFFCHACKFEIEDKLGSDETLSLRRRFALDHELMKSFYNHDIFVRIELRLNKMWRFKAIEIFIDDPEKDFPDYDIPIVATFHFKISDVMRHFFPWLDFDEDEDPEEIGNEFEIHFMEARLSRAALAFLELERFFRKSVTDVEFDEQEL